MDDLIRALQQGHAVLSGPTGSGKTTLVPLALLAGNVCSGQKLIMLEPRRIAARAAAVRMSEMLGEPVGTRIGYRTRTESKVSPATLIEVVTEGILIRRLQQDPELHGYGLVILDEFHERSIQVDLALALTFDLSQLRDDLRLLVMSATLDAEPICRLLDDAPHLAATGRSYPVEISHLPPVGDRNPMPVQMTHAVLHAWHHNEGDILAFLPGAGEIRQCGRALEAELPTALILPLYGNLSHQDQDRIFHRDNDRRRIILATPIAETSLTIEGITTVVDSGYYRRPVFDQGSGLTRLATCRISRASADQRAGRAGRLGPGRCYRLWSREVEHGLLAQTPPEIIAADLCSLVLELALWGVSDPCQLRWLDPPRTGAWETASQLLQRLTLLDRQGKITALGRRVVQLPMHPRLGVMLYQGAALGLGWTACLLAATLVERDLIRDDVSTADLELRVAGLARLADGKRALDPRMDKTLAHRLLGYASSWLTTLNAGRARQVALPDLGNLLAFAYPDRIARLRPDSTFRYKLALGSGAELRPGDPLQGTPLLVIPQLDHRQGDGRIFLAAAISEEDLQQHHGQLLTQVEEICWDNREGRVKAEAHLRLGNIVLRRRPLPDGDPERVLHAFLDGVRQDGGKHLPWCREARDLQARVCSLAIWQPGRWPDISDQSLLADLQWLAPYCQGFSNLERLRQVDLTAILRSLLDWQQQQRLDRFAPTHIQVPSGSRVRLDYRPPEPPVLAVRLQELFGLTDTPAVCDGTIPVVLHLLSPARRPIQITTDLRSFWTSTYQAVRRELAGRYPKHYWPDDPFTATATASTKKQLQAQRRQ